MSALSPTRLQRAEHYFTTHAVVIPDGISLDEAMKPEFWAHVAAQLRQGDLIRIIPEDDSYFAEALVRARGIGYAKLRLLRLDTFEDEIEDEIADQVGADDPVKVEFKGPHLKHCIIRCSDGHILAQGISLKADALREALNYARVAA